MHGECDSKRIDPPPRIKKEGVGEESEVQTPTFKKSLHCKRILRFKTTNFFYTSFIRF